MVVTGLEGYTLADLPSLVPATFTSSAILVPGGEMTIALNKATGVITGSFVATFDHATLPSQTKTLTFSGVLLPQSAATGIDWIDATVAQGYYLVGCTGTDSVPSNYPYNLSLPLLLMLSE